MAQMLLPAGDNFPGTAEGVVIGGASAPAGGKKDKKKEEKKAPKKVRDSGAHCQYERYP